MSKTHKKTLVRIARAVYQRGDRLGRPRWRITGVSEDGQPVEMRTRPGVSASYGCRLDSCLGDVLRVTYRQTPGGQLVADHWERGDFEGAFAAAAERASLALNCSEQARRALDNRVRL